MGKSTIFLTILVAIRANFALSLDFERSAPSYVDLPNFHQVEAGLYRSGQPSPKGINRLKLLGVSAIIDLRETLGDIKAEAAYTKSLGLGFFSVPMTSSIAPTDDQIKWILTSLSHRGNTVVEVHCRAGMDRTGLVIGLYRVFINQWQPRDAYQEMLSYGFHPEYQALDNYFKSKTGWSGI